MMAWAYFMVAIVVMYVCISTIGKLSGGSSDTLLASIRSVFTPLVLTLMVLGNVLFAIGTYYGFSVSSNALSITVAVGVIVSFIYSVQFMGVTVTLAKVCGLLLILLGIYLLR